MKRWRCWLCGLGFVHGRLLAGHLIDFHGEAAALKTWLKAKGL